MTLIARKKRTQRLVLLALITGSACASLSGALTATQYHQPAAARGPAR